MVPAPRVEAPPSPLLTLAVRAGAVLAAWVGIVVVEVMLVGTVYRPLFAGNWEIVQARRLVAPIVIALLLPASLVASLAGELVRRAARGRAAEFDHAAGKARGRAAEFDHAAGKARGRAVVALASGALLAALAYGVSFGRHMHAPGVRVPFVAGLGVAGVALGYVLPRLVARLSPWALVTSGVLVAVSAWVADLRVLPHLYPAFHAALFALLLAGSAWTIAALRPRSPGFLLVPALGIACLAWAPFAARRLRLADNLRFVLAEKTVVLARGVELAALVAPPPPLDEGAVRFDGPQAAEIPRALDWAGHDLLLISVDALRADHVSSYGYARPTTPNIDALAREGALFEEAYCPTPHTSYSVTSLMTGKAMRPLMALGLGRGSETWAAQLRRYGYRTAAFYPPAVFYIDAERFGAFEESRLDFEYAKVQFSSAEERVGEVVRYLDAAPPSPVFLWVHLFEPHEPYVAHPGFGSGATPVEAYDGEVAYADAAIGKIVALVRARRPGVAVVITADHGEEFGEHGGRYHGTTCYEEQVHVPLVVVGPGVVPGRVPDVVQTIDLLPTALSALGIPRPARVRGRDLGPLLAGTAREGADASRGLAYAETDDYALVARGKDRLLCARKVSACALYDVQADPLEKTDVAASHPEATRELRGLLAGIEHDVGRYEAGAAPWPDPIRRGLLRDADAAIDAAALLDDADVAIRRKAAEVMFLLHAPATAPETRRALSRDEDGDVRGWCALALVRMGEPPPPLAATLVRGGDVAWRRRAALAFASQGDARGGGELAAFWREEAPPKGSLDVEEAKELLAAMARIRDVEAVPDLSRSLPFVPLRPFLADALGAIGDARGRGPLLDLFAKERYETARGHEARALFALGARRELLAPLERFAGLPEPMIDAIALARDAKLLDPKTGGLGLEAPRADVAARITVPEGNGPLRLLVLAAASGGELSGAALGETLGPGVEAGTVHIRELGGRGELARGDGRLELHEPTGILAAWVVPRSDAAPFDLGAPDK
jgi:arylsulfatase A-like enzyme